MTEQLRSEDEAKIIDHARTYPYGVPDRSFVLLRGVAYPFAGLASSDWGSSTIETDAGRRPLREVVVESSGPTIDVDERRVAVVASGSNASPAQLRRKFPDFEGKCIPVVAATLEDHDIVFSAHVSRFGSVPVTLMASPGTSVHVFLTFLTADEEDGMFKTEGGNYDYVRLDTAEATFVDTHADLDGLRAYVSRYGALNLGGAPVGLAGTTVRDSRFERITESDAIDRVAPMFGMSGDELILRCVADQSLRRSCIARLSAESIPLGVSATTLKAPETSGA